MDEMTLFMAANKIYEPSYVSLESALAYYEIIPETVLGVTSISSRKTKTFENAWGVFSYRSIKPEYMIGYQVICKNPQASKLSFQGGTALRIVHGNSRFSDDIDLGNIGLSWQAMLLHS